jgi:CRP-like cAMP-binding protein
MNTLSNEELLLLNKVGLFSNLEPGVITQVAQIGNIHRLEPNTFLFHQGEPATNIYIVIRGRIKLTQITPDGQQVTLGYFMPGDAIAIIAVLSEMDFPATSQSVEASRVLGWKKDDMKALMVKHSQLAINALSILADRMHEFQDRIRELSTERVERRIARAILRLGRQVGRKVPEGVLIDLAISQQELAEMTGTTLFTVSRTLNKWEAIGLVHCKREQITICKPHSLVSIADDLTPKNPASKR